MSSSSKMYKVLYKGYNGGYQLSNEMTLEDAQKYKQKCIDVGYPEVYIIDIIE